MRTAEQEVQRAVPDAECFGPPIYTKPGNERSVPKYIIVSQKLGKDLGYGETEFEAWQDVLDRMGEGG